MGAVYVDPVAAHPPEAVAPRARRCGARWCHMWSDPDDVADLHRVAAAIGLRREWFQDRAGFPHYDLTPSRRARALRAGAAEASLRGWVAARAARIAAARAD